MKRENIQNKEVNKIVSVYNTYHVMLLLSYHILPCIIKDLDQMLM